MAGLGDKFRDVKNTLTGDHKPGRWEDESATHRSACVDCEDTPGKRWEDNEPAHRYGWEAANDQRYNNRSWSEAEPDLRRDWESTKGRPGWDQASAHASNAWHQTIQLREERLRPVKEQQQVGEVRVGKEVVTEQRSVDVPVTHEEVVIERHAVDAKPVRGEIGVDDKVVSVPVTKEQVHLEKETVVTEEVNVGKRAVTETEHLTGTVRHEELRTDDAGNVRARGEDERRPPTRP